MSPLQTLPRAWRQHGPALLAPTDDPHAEVLALLWGPRFDREHAWRLLSPWLARQPEAASAALPTLHELAERFDGLTPAQQQHLRRVVLRHRARSLGRCDNAPCPASC